MMPRGDPGSPPNVSCGHDLAAIYRAFAGMVHELLLYLEHRAEGAWVVCH